MAFPFIQVPLHFWRINKYGVTFISLDRREPSGLAGAPASAGCLGEAEGSGGSGAPPRDPTGQAGLPPWSSAAPPATGSLEKQLRAPSCTPSPNPPAAAGRDPRAFRGRVRPQLAEARPAGTGSAATLGKRAHARGTQPWCLCLQAWRQGPKDVSIWETGMAVFPVPRERRVRVPPNTPLEGRVSRSPQPCVTKEHACRWLSESSPPFSGCSWAPIPW